MGALPTELRNQLSKACVAAREDAEKGARAALQALAVHHHEPHGSMTTEQRALRNRLRAHGRQLGDTRDAKRGTQTIDRLLHECAYEHWHRMLFARFLAENHLLIEPSSGVAITMEECEELARDAGEDPWALASRFAQRMLPQIFRPDDPVLAVGLPPETRQVLERLLADLPSAIFTADDALGWTYQFWQSAEKDRVNASGEKITGATLPAVTQLFTEHYMVLFLLHNTIGAWHAGRVLAQRPELAEGAASEQELRDAVALDDYQFEYLRFVREQREGDEEGNPMGPWQPAAGTFGDWPKRAAELTVLDPCCGSGHFLVEVFSLLVSLRMAEEGLSLDDAIRAVLKDNVFGLELDARCTQIAAFNLALAAWRMVGRVMELPELNIACSGLGPQSTEEQWLKLAEQAPDAWKRLPAHARGPVRNGLANLHRLFSQAPELGSLIEPEELPADLITADYETLRPFLDEVFKVEAGDDEAHERVVAARGMTKTAQILIGPSDGYALVLTNVPYRNRGDLGRVLGEYVDSHFNSARDNLGTVFAERSLRWLKPGGTTALVTPQTWLFLPSYHTLRQKLLLNHVFAIIAGLGAKAFRTPMWDFAIMLLVMARGPQERQDSAYAALDVADAPTPEQKADQLQNVSIEQVVQSRQQKNPDYRIDLHVQPSGDTLANCATFANGIQTGDRPRHVACFWEFASVDAGWRLLQTTVAKSAHYDGCSLVVRWDSEKDEIPDAPGAVIRGRQAWGRPGITVSAMGSLPVALYSGERYDENCVTLIPKSPEQLPAIWCYCSSERYRIAVRQICKALKVRRHLIQVPFSLDEWQNKAAEHPGGVPEPRSHVPSQWIFAGHPIDSVGALVLQVGISRLVGYRWPAELDEEMRLAPEAHELVRSCTGLAEHADEDGIVCLAPARGERSAADRLRGLLAAAFGDAWSASKERELLQAAANEFNKGKAAKSLEDWLVERFFEEHCRLFHQRPFVWHIWDGRADGFNAMVNYHKLAGTEGEGRRTLESLTFSYLGDWIERQRADQAEGKEGADARLAAALDLQEQLKKILAGEPPYDIFVRWKPLHEQPIGWEPDINDGVRLNIRPFMSATLRKGGKKGAGILRAKPNINWKKDRGKEPESLRPKVAFPWFWSCDPEKKPEHRKDFMGGAKFDGNRWNDLHYSNEAKRAARERATKEQ